MNPDKKQGTPRSYPPFWERIVPIVLIALGVVVLGIIIVAVSVALGIFPGGG